VWYHIAGVKDGTTYNLYVNGVLDATTTNASVPSDSRAGDLIIGSTYLFDGYISNMRIVNGTAVYTSNFTPSTVPLTTITNTIFLVNLYF
jgi:hypothetical protein